MLLDYNPIQGKVANDLAYKIKQPYSPINRWVQSYWQLTVPKGKFHYHSVPDNCVDWIINLDCFDDSFIIPPFLSSTLFHIDGPASFFGIRFRILGHQGLISVPIGEWGDATSVKAEELIRADFVYSLFEGFDNTSGFDKCCDRLSTLILSELTVAEIDPRLVRYIQYCYNNVNSKLDLSDSQISEFGVSARQLRRLTKQHIGLLPKDFGRILRFQSALKEMSVSQHSKSYLDHYYDQPHFVREFKRFSGVTPNQFRKMSVLYNHYSAK